MTENKCYRVESTSSKTDLNLGGYKGSGGTVYGALQEFIKANEGKLRDLTLEDITIKCYVVTANEMKERILKSTQQRP